MLFYKESSIRNSFKCRKCLISLDEHKPPRLMPCGKTICNQCNQTYLSQEDIKCEFCLSIHEKKENGFIINDSLLELVNHKPKRVSRGNENQNLNENPEKYYKESILVNLFKCQKCEMPNFEFEQAKALPCCGKTVCHECIQKITKRVNENKFNCDLCLKASYLPENGFIVNEIISELINIQPVDINRGNKVDRLVLNLKNIEFLLNTIKFDCENFEVNVVDYCNEQKRLIQLTTEENQLNLKNEAKQLELSNLNEKLINEVEVFEKNCKKNFEDKTEFKKKIKLFINKHMKFLDYWKVFLNEYHIYEDEIATLNSLTQNIKLELHQQIKTIKQEKFGKKILQFNPENIAVYYEPLKYKFISCSYDITVKLWDYDSGKCEKTYVGHSWEVTSLQKYNEDKLISGSVEGTIKVWEIETAKCLITIKAYDHIESPNLYPPKFFNKKNQNLDGGGLHSICLLENDRLASVGADDGVIKIWNLKNGQCIKEFEKIGAKTFHVCRIFADNIITFSTDNFLRVWVVETGKMLKEHDCNGCTITCIRQFSLETILIGDAKKKSNGTNHYKIKIWNVANEKCLKMFECSDMIQSLLKISNKKIAAGYDEGEIEIFCLETNSSIMKIQAFYRPVWHLDNLWENTIISSSKDPEIKVWDIVTGKCIKTFIGHKSDVWIVKVLR